MVDKNAKKVGENRVFLPIFATKRPFSPTHRSFPEIFTAVWCKI